MEGDGMVGCPNILYTLPDILLWAGTQVCVIITISDTSNHINYFLFLYAIYIYIYIHTQV